MACTSLKPAYGGPAQSVAGLAMALQASGSEVFLWAQDGSASDTPLISRDSKVLRFQGELKGALSRVGPIDVIHDNGIWLKHNHQVAVYARSAGLPRIVSTRGMLQPWALQHKRLKKQLAWLAYQRRDLNSASELHATAESEAEALARRVQGPSIRVIPNGVEVPAVDRAKPTHACRQALFLGRIYPVKGVLMLIEAWGRLRPKGWRLVAAGPDEAGHLAEALRAVRTLNAENLISFPGPLDEDQKRHAFLESDLLVAPSFSESFGMAIAEALAHGLPVLTTTAAPWPLLESRKCGWRVEPNVPSLVAGLEVATGTGHDILRAMGKNGRDVISEQYAWPTISQQFLTLYRKVSRQS